MNAPTPHSKRRSLIADLAATPPVAALPAAASEPAAPSPSTVISASSPTPAPLAMTEGVEALSQAPISKKRAHAKPMAETFTVRMSVDIADMVRRIARYRGLPISLITEVALLTEIERYLRQGGGMAPSTSGASTGATVEQIQHRLKTLRVRGP